MTKIDETIKIPTAPNPSIKPVDKKVKIAQNIAKQQKVNANKHIVNKSQMSNRRTGNR